MFLANWSNGAYVLFSIIALLIVSGLGVLLFFSFQKEKRNYRNEVAGLVEGVLKKNEIFSSVSNYISKSPNSLIFSLILIDYDKLTEIQNAFGEANCKKVLTESIKNVRKVLPNRALIGRISEERFLVLIKEDYDKNETLRCANKICETAHDGIKIYSDTVISPNVNVGVAFYPNHGRNIKQLLKSLDLAVFNSNNQGGNCVSIYSDEFDKNDNDNLQLYYEIKQAIKEHQFCLYYQPIINVKDDNIYGFEALLRWKHPSLGILYPASFINILEQSGDIKLVGAWGIETLIREYIELKKQFVNKDIQLSLNLSPKQLVSETLGVTFQNIAKKYKVPVSSITIEIVEFAMFEKHEMVYKNINNLKELGFKIAVDGVGLDQNTLVKLSNSPIDIIKLDKTFFDYEDSFVQDRYIELLVDLAKTSNKMIICEGVENYELLNKVKKFGIDYVQGYYFSKPIPQENVISYIEEESSISELTNIRKVEEVVFDLEENNDELLNEILEKEENFVETSKEEITPSLNETNNEKNEEENKEEITPSLSETNDEKNEEESKEEITPLLSETNDEKNEEESKEEITPSLSETNDEKNEEESKEEITPSLSETNDEKNEGESKEEITPSLSETNDEKNEEENKEEIKEPKPKSAASSKAKSGESKASTKKASSTSTKAKSGESKASTKKTSSTSTKAKSEESKASTKKTSSTSTKAKSGESKASTKKASSTSTSAKKKTTNSKSIDSKVVEEKNNKISQNTEKVEEKLENNSL